METQTPAPSNPRLVWRAYVPSYHISSFSSSVGPQTQGLRSFLDQAPPPAHLPQLFTAEAELRAMAGSARHSWLPLFLTRNETFLSIMKTFPEQFYCSPHCLQHHSCSHLLPAQQRAATASPSQNRCTREMWHEGLCSPAGGSPAWHLGSHCTEPHTGTNTLPGSMCVDVSAEEFIILCAQNYSHTSRDNPASFFPAYRHHHPLLRALTEKF